MFLLHLKKTVKLKAQIVSKNTNYEVRLNKKKRRRFGEELEQSDVVRKISTSDFPGKPGTAQATIQGPEDVYVKKGSTISLTCSVNVHSTPPSSVLWYHGPSVVDFDSPRGGISLETEKTESGTTSRLLVTKASLVDSGNYTCVPSNANPSSVWVHVLNGEHPAAMQHGEHSSSGVARSLTGTAHLILPGLALTSLFRCCSHLAR
ncbi:hypothetical protein RUM43_000108 [Polyplax serrata]|uniref:Ig-like domain-containing protein n=1 Tax=Polyplax serrata TaxID=468196 RepID=A0AAN8SBZ5_POLSC